MKYIYCTKCGGKVPGLEGNDFHQYALVYNRCVQSVKDYRRHHNTSLEETPTKDLYRPALDKYEELTNFKGDDAFHIYRKHQVSRYKLYCEKCNLCYIAPTTGKCPECGKVNHA